MVGGLDGVYRIEYYGQTVQNNGLKIKEQTKIDKRNQNGE